MSAFVEVVFESRGSTEIHFQRPDIEIDFAPGPSVEILVDKNGEIILTDASTEVQCLDDSDAAVEVHIDADIQVQVEMAVAGPRGRQGPAGGASIEYPFSWGDATPASLDEHMGVVVSVSIVILTPFDGPPSAISINAGAAVLMPAEGNLPSEAARYEANPGVRLTEPTLITLSITPGLGTSAGNGIAYLEIAQ